MSDEANIYPPLTKEEIEAVIDNSVNSDKLENLLDVNFVGLDRPCSVSLGIDCGTSLDNTRIELISEILKSYGIDVVDRSSPDALDPSKYILDESGISLPFMEPREALKATAELNDIFISHGFKVTGYASPRTQESLCLSTKYEGKTIDVLGEIDDNPQAKAMLERRGISAEDFIQQQLEEASKLPAIDVMNVENTALTPGVGIKYLYRGGSLGDNPYAVVAAKRSKDIVYSSPKMETALEYSTGLEAGFAKVNTPDGKILKYGNIYRYSATEDLNLWRDFGYEKGMAPVSATYGYETPVFAHKNNVNGVFFAVRDLKTQDIRVVQITDDNGKYISKEWEDFMMLHAPRMRAGTELDKQRNDNQIKMLAEGKLSSWNVHPHGKTLDLSKYDDIDLSGVDLSQFDDLKLPEKIAKLSGAKFPMNMKQLDLSKSDDINLLDADLSQFEDLRLPEKIKLLKGTKFPMNMKQLDLSKSDGINLADADLSQFEDLKLPEKITGLFRTKFPMNMKQLDLSKSDDINLSGADLSQFDDLKLPEKITKLSDTKFPMNMKQLDLSKSDDIDLSGADLSQFDDLKLPANIMSLEKTRFPEGRKWFEFCDFSQIGETWRLPDGVSSLEGIQFPETLKRLDLGNWKNFDFSGVDLLKIEELKLSPAIKSLEGIKLPKTLKQLDVSDCYGFDFSKVDLFNVEKLVVSYCENADFSAFNGELEFAAHTELRNVKLPAKMTSLDLTKVTLSQISATDLSQIEELKMPKYFFRSETLAGEELKDLFGADEEKLQKEVSSCSIISPDCKLDNLKKLDVSLCKNADLRDWNLDKIEELKLPKNFDVSKLPEGIMERNPAVARAVKISQGEIVETLEQTVVKEKVLAEQEVKAGAMPPPIEKQLQQEAKTEKTLRKVENPAAEKIQQLRGVENSGAQAAAEAGEKVAEKAAARAGAEAVKSSEGIVSAIAKADNAVNQAIDKTIDKGSELLNNNAVGRAYEKAAEKVADTKVVKAVEKTTAKVAEKAAQTTVGKAVVKAAAKTAGSAVGKSLLKKIPLVSLGAGAYFAWDRLKEGDWKGACGEMASGALGCLPGVGTAASAAIDVGLAAKDIKTAVDESKEAAAADQPKEAEAAGTSSGSKTEEDKKKVKEIILQKRGQHLPEVQAKVQSTPQNNNYLLQQKAAQQGRG